MRKILNCQALSIFTIIIPMTCYAQKFATLHELDSIENTVKVTRQTNHKNLYDRPYPTRIRIIANKFCKPYKIIYYKSNIHNGLERIKIDDMYNKEQDSYLFWLRPHNHFLFASVTKYENLPPFLKFGLLSVGEYTGKKLIKSGKNWILYENAVCDNTTEKKKINNVWESSFYSYHYLYDFSILADTFCRCKSRYSTNLKYWREDDTNNYIERFTTTITSVVILNENFVPLRVYLPATCNAPVTRLDISDGEHIYKTQVPTWETLIHGDINYFIQPPTTKGIDISQNNAVWDFLKKWKYWQPDTRWNLSIN